MTITNFSDIIILVREKPYKYWASRERRIMNEMTSKEVVNLIDWLKKQGLDAEKILECIEYIEKHEPEKN